MARRVTRLKARIIRDIVRENLHTVNGVRPGRRPRRGALRAWPLVLAAIGAGGLLLGLASTAPARAGRARAAARAEVSAAKGPEVLPAPRPLDPALFQLAVKTVVVDPGHGGSDPGALGPGRLEEKDVTFDIAARLCTLLRRDGFHVILTRAGDETVSLERRVEIANSARADLFLSVHLNSIPLPQRLGVETYYLGDTSDPEAARLAHEENAGSGYTLADFRKLLEQVYTDVRQDESRRFAGDLQAGLYASLHETDRLVRDRGVKTAPLVVLAGTRMPAVLAEVSCISNRQEARRLTLPAYREQIAEALLAGVRNYVDARWPQQSPVESRAAR